MGGSSGGGSSGQVNYPIYMRDQHELWLDEVTAGITAAATGDNPYTTSVAYDPDCVLNASNFIISQFNDFVIALAPEADWGSAYNVVAAKLSFPDYFSTSATATTVSAFQADLEARRDNDFKPAYKVGMLNVNAVMSSAFVIGDALLTSEVARNVASFSGELVFKNEERQANYELGQAKLVTSSTRDIINSISQQASFYQAVASITVDANRIKIVAKGEENRENVDYAVKDSLYDLELYQYGGNMLASIGGGTVSAAGSKPSTAASVLGGALSGAAAGASVGGPIGAGIGAVVGGLAGLLS